MAGSASVAGGLDLVYAGTPEFAVPALNALVAAGHRVHLVLTQPDRPSGRGRRSQAPPVRRAAEELGLEIAQPQRLDETAREAIAACRPDAMVVTAYGQLLPQSVLDLPRLGCINIHASLLPRWRGAAPIQRALLAGDRQTGITIMQMDRGLDTGPILSQHPVPIVADETGGSLHDKLAGLSGPAITETLAERAAGRCQPRPQPEQGVTYARRLDKTEALLDWRQPAAELERRIRAFVPWPVAFTHWHGRALRIHAAEVAQASGAPGEILRLDAGGPVVAAGTEGLRLTRVQLPGKRPVSGRDFANAGGRPGERME